MARIVIIGGHGKVALLAARKLARAGHDVTSVFRNPGHAAEVAATGAMPRAGDVESMDVDALEEMLRGHDIVIWSAGAGGGNPQRTSAVDRDAAIRSIDASQAAGAGRYIMVSYLGAGLDHGIAPDDPFFPYAEAKAAADEHLRATDLDWTILMPGMLTNEPSRRCVQFGRGATGTTSRELVADVIEAVVAADVDKVTHTDLPFTDGDVPITTALAGLREG